MPYVMAASGMMAATEGAKPRYRPRTPSYLQSVSQAVNGRGGVIIVLDRRGWSYKAGRVRQDSGHEGRVSVCVVLLGLCLNCSYTVGTI